MAKLPALIRTAPHIERRIHEALTDESRKPSERDGRLGLSQLGDCERNLWAGMNGIPEDKEIEPRILVLFKHGHAVEAHVIDLMRTAGLNVLDRDPKTGEQFTVEDFNGKLASHIDGLVECGKNGFLLLEVKSASEKKFDELLAAGYEAWNPKYAAQLQAYMGYFKLDDSLAVVYEKNTSRIHAEKVRFDPVRFGELHAKAKRVVTSTEVLPKPPEAKSRYCAFCKYCSRGDWCFSPLAGLTFDE